MIPTAHLEIIMWAGVTAAAVVTTVVTFAFTLAYLISREREHTAPKVVVTAAVPKTPAVHDRHATETPAAVAG
jgi:hypothetical protein